MTRAGAFDDEGYQVVPSRHCVELQESRRGPRSGQQGFDLRPAVRITSTGCSEIGGALCERLGQGGVKDRFFICLIGTMNCSRRILRCTMRQKQPSSPQENDKRQENLFGVHGVAAARISTRSQQRA